MQLPCATSDTLLPETEQFDGESEVRVTGRPEDAVADRAIVVPIGPLTGAWKLMVCGTIAVTEKL